MGVVAETIAARSGRRFGSRREIAPRKDCSARAVLAWLGMDVWNFSSWGGESCELTAESVQSGEFGRGLTRVL
jgi:hypothetical protein